MFGAVASARNRTRLSPGDQNPSSRSSSGQAVTSMLGLAERVAAAPLPGPVPPAWIWRSAASSSSLTLPRQPTCRMGHDRTPRPAHSKPQLGVCMALPSPGGCGACPGPQPTAGTAACRLVAQAAQAVEVAQGGRLDRLGLQVPGGIAESDSSLEASRGHDDHLGAPECLGVSRPAFHAPQSR